MNTTRLKRLLGATAATTLVVAGASLGLAASASAADIIFYHEDILTSETGPEGAYSGWHEGDASDVDNSFAVKWDGMHLGSPDSTQILNGFVNNGEPGLPVTQAELRALIDSASLHVVDGTAYMQVPVTTTSGWTTLRPVVGATGPASPDPAVDLWTSSQNIGTIVANAPVLLDDLLTTLAAQGDLRYSGFGFYADNTDPAIVEFIGWDGTNHYFGIPYSYIPLTSEVVVTEEDIRPNEDTYPGWHEGYDNATPAYSVEEDGLHFGIGANSQIINGLNPPLVDANLYTLLYSAGLTVVSGEAYFQVPVSYGPADLFTTIRPADGAGPGYTAWDLTDMWVSSNTIPATPNTDQVPANTPVVLGDLIEALTLQGGPVDVLAFGVLAQAGTPAVVSEIEWNGVTYLFEPAAEVLPATGTDVVPGGVAAALLLFAGLGALVFARRHRTARG